MTRDKHVTEAEVLRGCVAAAAMLGVELRRHNVGMAINPEGQPVRFGQPGELDLRGVLPDGRAIEVEAKRPGRKPTPAQWDRIEFLNRSNAVGLWTDCPAWLARLLPVILAGAAVSWPGRDDRCEVDPGMKFNTPAKEAPR